MVEMWFCGWKIVEMWFCGWKMVGRWLKCGFVVEMWFVSDQILMFCTVCSRIGKDNNIFVKGTNQYRKDYLVHHNNQPKHISNLDLIKNQRKIFTLFSKTQIKKIQNNNNNSSP